MVGTVMAENEGKAEGKMLVSSLMQQDFPLTVLSRMLA
jgi:hypothetical protein